MSFSNVVQTLLWLIQLYRFLILSSTALFPIFVLFVMLSRMKTFLPSFSTIQNSLIPGCTLIMEKVVLDHMCTCHTTTYSGTITEINSTKKNRHIIYSYRRAIGKNMHTKPEGRIMKCLNLKRFIFHPFCIPN